MSLHLQRLTGGGVDLHYALPVRGNLGLLNALVAQNQAALRGPGSYRQSKGLGPHDVSRIIGVVLS